MYGLLRRRIDEHGTQAEIEKVGAEATPRLAGQEVHAGVLVGTRAGRSQLVVVLNDCVVTLLGNEEESIGHLEGFWIGWRWTAAQFLYQPILQIGIYEQSIRI
jgi:hypothetical protein